MHLVKLVYVACRMTLVHLAHLVHLVRPVHLVRLAHLLHLAPSADRLRLMRSAQEALILVIGGTTPF